MWDYDEPRLEAFRPTKPLDPEKIVANQKNLNLLVQQKNVVDASQLLFKLWGKKNTLDKELEVIFYGVFLLLFT